MSSQCCRVTFEWLGVGDPIPIKDFPVTLKGITAGMSLPRVKLYVPLSIEDNINSGNVITVTSYFCNIWVFFLISEQRNTIVQ